MDTQGKRYVIFLDIDGTLLGSSHAALQKNIDVIQKVRSLGHKVLVNTGRATAYMPKDVDVEKYFDGVVSGAGARVVLDKKEIFCRPVSRDSIRRFCEACFEIDNVSILEGMEKMYLVGSARGTAYNWDCITRENLDEYMDKGIKIEKFTMLGNAPAGLGDVMGRDYVFLQHAAYAEVIQRACTKAGAMKVVLDYLKLPVEQSIAMGDSLNDFDMIEAAGIGVAMGNAIPEIKNIATFTTTHVDEAGVAAALEKLFNI